MKPFVPIIFIICVHIATYAQMPDWAMMVDKEGNKYYFDKRGKIYTDDAELTYRPVSRDGLEYYTSKVKSLWKAGHRKQSLVIAKSILALKESSMNIVKAKKDIIAFMRDIQMKHGKRFVDINRDAWLYLTREDTTMYIFNDKVPYIVALQGNSEIIAAKSVDSLQYSSTVMRAGIRFSDTSGYDAIMTIVAESFAGTIESIRVLEQHWRTIAFDTFDRELLKYSDSIALYSFVTRDNVELKGMELLLAKENRGYCVRIFTTKERYDLYKDTMLTIINSFSTP
ncbi:MAG TPA: hypothetical protein P5547_13420 [Spirochaetota bacterium]|nr:hypothetical protein [Spirochaetota bacterium]